MSVQILTGDCRAVLKTLPDESVNCVVTSPPYWGLRDYGNGETGIGLEPTMQEHIIALRDVFRDVRRVLRSDGTLWLNYGDAYASSTNGRSAADTKAAGNDDRTFRDKPIDTTKGSGLKAKDLMGMPWRVAFALQDDGWYLRQDIIWAKPNPMPESVTDRCTKAHEYIFLFARSSRYAFDADAISEVAVYLAGEGGHQSFGKPGGKAEVAYGSLVSGKKWDSDGTRNARSVWTIPTSPFPEAHFATFPPELAERCIKAGCPEGGTVLDPFFGAGTSGLVADRLRRNCIGIEINPAYAEMARNRIAKDAGMFAEVASA